MQKIIRTVDEKKGIVQITVADERWYLKPSINPDTKVPEYTPVPSVTWIAGHYPKGVEFYKWLAGKGWDEAETIKKEAGEKGSRVHKAIEMILNGQEFRIDTKVPDYVKSTEQETVYSELSYDELICVTSFIAWRDEFQPDEIIAIEKNVFSDKYNTAGTIDLICKKDGVVYIIDFKTSAHIWESHEIQISAYKKMIENGENPLFKINENGSESNEIYDVSNVKVAILQVGYKRNKNGYKFTEIEDKFDLFLLSQKIWENEVGKNNPGFTKRDFPIILAHDKKATPTKGAESVEEIIKKKSKK